jgi:cytochrome c-type biogenesis protein CcmF
MAFVGRACLIADLAICLAGIGFALTGSGRRARRAVYLLAAVTTLAFALLERAFLRSDFSYETVAAHSSSTTPTFYKATAMWSSQEGSLLLWLLLLSLWSALVLRLVRDRLPEVTRYATAVLLGFGAFFSMLCVFFVHPFTTLAAAPAEGLGLNPLLRHPMMMIHPPALYSGYTLFTVPFSFAVGALVAGRFDAAWIRETRRFALAAWLFLALGITLGARWSYTELGWGGYWAWDPVENASLLPWLTGTAFIHSIMIQERRGMLKIWNASLILATGILAIMGTFLVRSGILNSIHAFGQSTVGVPFLVLIGALVALSVGLVLWRTERLKSEHHLDSLLSREAMFVLNNFVLVALAFVVFWGTFFPIITEVFTGTKQVIGPPWFDKAVTPLALALVSLAGIGPVIAWRRTTPARLVRLLRAPLGAAALVLATTAATLGTQHRSALAMFALATFALTVAAQETWRGARARRASTGDALPRAALGLVARNRRRYGGYLVHTGIAVVFLGIAGSSSFAHVAETRLEPGGSRRVGDYTYTYRRATGSVDHDPRATGAIMTLGAVLDVTRDGRHVTTLRPERGYFPDPDPRVGSVSRLIAGEPTSEVALKAGLRHDQWAALTPDIHRLDPIFTRADQRIPANRPDLQLKVLDLVARYYALSRPAADFRIIDSPIVTWIWLGALIAFAGAGLALSPSRRRRARAATPRLEALEAARTAKYAEIHDAELDLDVGKLAPADHAAIDRRLRAEALMILDAIDSAGAPDTTTERVHS